MKRLVPRTYAGFPVGKKAGSVRESGLALLIAVLSVAMVMIFAADMIIKSSVNLELSISKRDSIKAEYLAKSGYNLALMLLTGDFVVDLLRAKLTKTELSDSNAVEEIWSLVNGIPIGADTVELLEATQESFNLNAINDEDAIDVLKMFDGMFVIDVEDESGKINLNDCAEGKCLQVRAMLKALMSCPVEKAFMNQPGRDVTPDQIVARIRDWVDKDGKAEPDSGFGDEDDPYRKKFPAYNAKNAPFDSVDELRLIEGWDEEMHQVFSPYLTVYPFKKPIEDARLNINTASRALLTCLLHESKVDCNEKAELRFKERSADKVPFASSAKELKSVLKDSFCYSPKSSENANENREKWFKMRSNVFRIKVEGQVGTQLRKLEAVIERQMPDKSKKITNAYQILYWKMI